MYSPWAIPDDPRKYANYLGVSVDAVTSYANDVERDRGRLDYATDEASLQEDED